MLQTTTYLYSNLQLFKVSQSLACPLVSWTSTAHPVPGDGKKMEEIFGDATSINLRMLQIPLLQILLLPESSKGLKFEPQKTHQKQTVWGWNLTLLEGLATTTTTTTTTTTAATATTATATTATTTFTLWNIGTQWGSGTFGTNSWECAPLYSLRMLLSDIGSL